MVVAVLLLAGCFRPTPCTDDSECGGPGGRCDLNLSFCVTAAEVSDAAVDAGDVADAGPGDAGRDAGTDAGQDAGMDAGFDAGLAPTVLATTPLPPRTNVPIEVRPTATFSQAMDASTISALSFKLMQGVHRIDGGVSFDEATNLATFAPGVPLQTDLIYTATITTGATSAGGVALEASHSWTFTTALLALRSAQTYSVLGAAVSNTGSTRLSGDLGVSTAALIMGGATITVGGTTHANDAAATQARLDALVAYDAAAALTPSTSLATLNDLTLTAGVYTSNAAALSLSTTLTLNGENNPDAVFIIQINAALNTGATTSNVRLVNGARAANVFWQVSGAVTLGATSTFRGTLLSMGAITIGAQTQLNGRALCINGQVTLASNAIAH